MSQLIRTPANWMEWSKIFTDACIWLPLLQEICIRTGISIAMPIEEESPGTCVVFIVGRKFVFKLFPPFLPSDYAHEVDAYRILGDRLDPFLARLVSHGIIEKIKSAGIIWFFNIAKDSRSAKLSMIRCHLA